MFLIVEALFWFMQKVIALTSTSTSRVLAKVKHHKGIPKEASLEYDLSI